MRSVDEKIATPEQQIGELRNKINKENQTEPLRERDVLELLDIDTSRAVVLINGKKEKWIKNVHISVGVDYPIALVTIEKYFDEIKPFGMNGADLQIN